jgi:hypothetical protein
MAGSIPFVLNASLACIAPDVLSGLPEYYKVNSWIMKSKPGFPYD